MRESDAVIGESKQSCAVAFAKERNAQLAASEFSFGGPSDAQNDSEAVAERVAILAVENGWNDARALQEARWDADRERCWRAFLQNARHIQEAPVNHREVLLAQYRTEASRRYGAGPGAIMADGLRAWVKARGVH